MTLTTYHWCNEETIIDYIKSVIVPYMTQKRRQLGLDLKHTGLLTLDEFKGRQSAVLNLLQNNDLVYVIIPPSCNDRLQPLNVSVNRAAKQFLQINLKTGMYADVVVVQKNIGKDIEPVDLKLFIVKSIAVKWMIDLYSCKSPDNLGWF